MAKKKTKPTKRTKATKKPKPDQVQAALAVVERAIGGKLSGNLHAGDGR